MRRTAAETTVQTLTRLIRAWDRRQPVTVSFTKADGSETTRTAEIFDISVSRAGDLVVEFMDRETRERRCFRVDRLRTYTVHRAAYRVPRESGPGGHGLAAATAVRVHLLSTATADRATTVLTNLLIAA